MNPLSQRGDSGFTLAGFLIIAALGASLWKGAPLDSVRPVGSQVTSYEQQYSQQVPARLWQDPFKAVSTHELTVAEGSRAISFVQSPAGAIRELMQRPGSGKTSSVTNLTIIAVMLNPGLYPELEERRRRRRYAVLAGLSEEHFVPRNSEVLSVFYLPKVFQGSSKAHLCRKSILRHGTDRLRTLQANCFSVPFEWYDYEDGQRKAMDNQQALILWINESQFADSPFLRLKMLLEELLPEDQKSTETVRISFNLLGPARSDSLKNMVNSDVADIKEWLCNSSKLSEFNIFSPTATVADKDIAASVADKDRTGTASEERYPLPKLQEKLRCEPPQTDRLPMHFLRTIQSDDVLIDKVTTELKHNRMIKSQDKIVLLSEWDTYFGRSLPRAFEKRYCDKKNGSECHLFHYSYMRGIDGVVSGETTPSFQKISTKTKNSEFSSSLEQTNLRRPVGSGQFDYLRRLANEIRQKDREWRLGDGNGVKAVVLLGSDVYDKLLILRALRPELSGALFVTTDLDAQFLHPSEYNWARGLIMATTYDLKLSSEIQKTTMPFRDSYQTSMYLSTRLIFNDQLRSQIGIENCPKKNEVAGNQSNSQDKIYELIPAQLFEVGRQRLISLRPHTYSTHFWNDTTTRSFAKSIAFGAFMIAVIGIFALHHLRPEAGRFVFFAGSVVLAFAVLGMPALLSSTDGQVEPFDFMSGVSVWPAIFMRLFASALSMMFIWIVIQKLRRNWEDLGSRFFAISFQK